LVRREIETKASKDTKTRGTEVLPSGEPSPHSALFHKNRFRSIKVIQKQKHAKVKTKKINKLKVRN